MIQHLGTEYKHVGNDLPDEELYDIYDDLLNDVMGIVVKQGSYTAFDELYAATALPPYTDIGLKLLLLYAFVEKYGLFAALGVSTDGLL